MRSEEINKWISKGGSLPQDLTEEEKVHLTKLGWSVDEHWHSNGQKSYEWNWFHGMKHGVFKEWYEDGDPLIDEEYYYGNKIKETS